MSIACECSDKSLHLPLTKPQGHCVSPRVVFCNSPKYTSLLRPSEEIAQELCRDRHRRATRVEQLARPDAHQGGVGESKKQQDANQI